MVSSTEISVDYLREEALDLLSYCHSTTGSGNFSIPYEVSPTLMTLFIGTFFLKLTDLRVEIRELVQLSFQGLDSNLRKLCRETIDRKGLRTTLCGLQH